MISNKQISYRIPTKVPSMTKNSKKTTKFSNLQTNISWNKIDRNINCESFMYYEVRIRYFDIFEHNYKISNIWYWFLHICSWGICYTYTDKLQPTSLVYHSSQLFSNWISIPPVNPPTPWLLLRRSFLQQWIPPYPSQMPAVDVGIGHLWVVVMFWNHLSSNSQTFDSAIHLSHWNQIFLDKHRQQIVVSKDGNHQRCLSWAFW